MTENERTRKKNRIIDLIGAGFTLTAAARACGIRRETLWRWRNKDFDFNAWIVARLIQRNLDPLEIDFKGLL
jgi:hypothetical protein